MSGEDDEPRPTSDISKNGAPEAAAAVTPDDPRVTPLGGNAGVHIQSEDEPDDDPTIDFGGFIVSLGTSCMVNLGQHPNPETGTVDVDIPAASQVIDILQMLQHKTRGNLSREEEKLLETLLHDLRKAFDDAGQ